MSLLSFLDRSHTVAKPGFSRWMVPPAALCVHLCIGQAYALSVFNLPMTKLLGISAVDSGRLEATELGWIFSIAMVFLGGSAAVFGRWVEGRTAPRDVHGRLPLGRWLHCFCLRRLVHQPWMVYLGYGVMGGIGIGLGYIRRFTR